MGNINIAGQSLPADEQDNFNNHQEDDNDAEELPPPSKYLGLPLS
jgi:hypothetical protein